MKIAITADNTCDIPEYLLKENDITLAYIPTIMGDSEYTNNINSDMIYDYVEKNNILPKTAALSVLDYKELFEKKLKNYDAVIHFSLSFGISSTGNNALLASQELENVYVIDTKSLSSGSGLLVLSCADKIKEGKDIDTIVSELKSEAEKVQASFLISKLNYLKKGGRCSSITAFGANLLGIKIRIQLVDGIMKAHKKYMGKMNFCLGKYLRDVLAEYQPDYNRVFVTSSSKMENVKDKFVEDIKALGFREVIIGDACSVISSHCGPGTIGVLYIKK